MTALKPYWIACNAYHEQTEPLVEFYRQRGKLVEVPDQGSIEATTAFLLKLLEA